MNNRNGGVGDFQAFGELADEIRRQVPLEFVLENCAGDGDTPSLRKGTKESEESEGGGGSLHGERSQRGEDGASKLSSLVSYFDGLCIPFESKRLTMIPLPAAFTS